MRSEISPSKTVQQGWISRTLAAREAWQKAQRPAAADEAPRLVVTIDQAAHGFTSAQVLRLNVVLSAWELADASTADPDDIFGIVLRVINANRVRVGMGGRLRISDPSSLLLSYPYLDFFLSSTTPGAWEPLGSGAASSIRLFRNADRRTGQFWHGGMNAPPAVRESAVVEITGGNTIYAATGSWPAVAGIKVAPSTITSVPTAAPGAGPYSDGLGVGLLQLPTGVSGGSVWVVNGSAQDSLGNVFSGTFPSIVIPKDSTVLCLQKIKMTVAAGGVTDVYLPFAV